MGRRFGFEVDPVFSVSGLLTPSLLQDFFEIFDQHRKVFLHYMPEQILIHAIVTMDQAMTHTDNLTPWNFSVRTSNFFGHAIGCLANDFDEPDEAVPKQPIGFQFVHLSIGDD